MDYKDINDYELLYMVSENSEDAIDILYKKYKPLIDKKIRNWSFIAKECGVDREDLEQEISLIFTKAYKSYSDNSSLFYTYFNFLVDNQLKNFFSNFKLEDKNIISIYEERSENSTIFDTIKSISLLPEEEVNYTEIVNKCNSFSFLLKEEQSLMFELYFHGYKIAEISKLVEKNSNTVSVTINRI